MKKSLLALALVAALAGCASTPVTNPQQAVFAAKSAYVGALTAAVTYKNLPVCSATRPAPCSRPELVAQIQKADNVAAAALDAAESAVRTPLVGATATDKAISAAQVALTALTSLLATLPLVKQ